MGNLARFAFSIGAAALFAGCGGSQPTTIALPNDFGLIGHTHHKTFRYVGEAEFFKVPKNVTQIHIVALGGNGGGRTVAFSGRVSADIPVKPLETLTIYVGGDGTLPDGGFNGGAPGGSTLEGGGGFGGGGASDVREGGSALKDRVLVAGGAGGQGAIVVPRWSQCGVGGKGGGEVAGKGKIGFNPYWGCVQKRCTSGCCFGGCPGVGGSQVAGGTGGLGGTGPFCYGTDGNNGSLGTGGAGAGEGSGSYSCGGYGGGGGGGYYGGGGGGEGADDDSGSGTGGGGGGGGGSSYAEPSATSVHMWRGWKSARGSGLVDFSWQ